MASGRVAPRARLILFAVSFRRGWPKLHGLNCRHRACLQEVDQQPALPMAAMADESRIHKM